MLPKPKKRKTKRNSTKNPAPAGFFICASYSKRHPAFIGGSAKPKKFSLWLNGCRDKHGMTTYYYKMLPDIIYITDSKDHDPLKAAKKLKPGSIVILRDYELSDTKRFSLGKELQGICRKRRLLLLVAKTPELAEELGADGIHLPEFMVGKAARIRKKHPYWLITASAHSGKAVSNAVMAGAHAVLISPVFATSSHKGTKPLGLHRTKKMILPYIYCYALGGCNPRQLPLLKAFGFQGLAGVSGLK